MSDKQFSAQDVLDILDQAKEIVQERARAGAHLGHCEDCKSELSPGLYGDPYCKRCYIARQEDKKRRYSGMKNYREKI